MDYLATGEVTLTELVSMLRNVYTLFATTQVSWLTVPRNGHNSGRLPLCVCVPRGLQQGSPLHARPQSGHVVVWISGGALFRINVNFYRNAALAMWSMGAFLQNGSRKL